MLRSPTKALAVAGAMLLPAMLLPAGATAAVIADAAGDFLPTYTGPKGADLDVVETRFGFDGSNFRIYGKMAGRIGKTPGAFYVFGVERGANIPGFTDIVSGVTFDSVVVIQADGTGIVQDFFGPATPLGPSDITVAGKRFIATVPASALPSQGLALRAYSGNLWPEFAPGLVSELVSDFAPDAGNFAVTPIPPALPLLGAALGGLAWLRRRRGSERNPVPAASL